MHKWSLVGGGQAPSRPPPDGTRFGLITSARHSRSSSGHAGAMSTVININDVLDGHVRFSVDCVDRVLLNAYVPTLQTSGGVAYFMREHLGLPIPSPAVMEKIGNRFRREVRAFAETEGIPILHLKKPDRSRWDDRKLDHVSPTSSEPSVRGTSASSPSSLPSYCRRASSRPALEE